MSLLCRFGAHRRKYVGVANIEDVTFAAKWGRMCSHGYYGRENCLTCSKTSQIARWVCVCCGAMGERYIKRGQGVFTVTFGKLVPDEKRWANPNPEEAR